MSLLENGADKPTSLLNNTNEIPDNPFEALVGDGKKFKTQDDLAKSVFHKDSHISKIERENAEMRELLSKNDRTEKLESMLTELLTRNKPSNEVPPQTQEKPGVTSPGLTEEDLEKRLESLLGKKTAEQTSKANLQEVREKLVAKYGSNFADTLKQKATELGLNDEDVNGLASRNPRLFYKTFDIDVKAPTPSPSLTNKVNAGVSPSFDGSGPKPRSHYVALKNKDRASYYSPATQRAMEKDALALGSAFFDTKD